MELKQSIFLKGSRQLKLMPDDTLRVEIRSDGAVSEFSIPLCTLDPSPMRKKQPPSKFVFGFVVCAFLLLGSFAAQLFAVSDIRIVLGVLSFLLMLPFGFSLYRLWRFTYDITVFYDRSSGQAAFTLFTDKPDPSTFREFVSHLTKQIKSADMRDPNGRADSIAAELQSFAKLKEQGILTEEEFKTIKQRLLDKLNTGTAVIGFKR